MSHLKENVLGRNKKFEKRDLPNKKFKFSIISYIYDKHIIGDMGGYRRVWEFAEHLKKLGHEVIVFVPKFGDPQKQTFVKVVEIPFLDLNFLRSISFHLFLFFFLLFYAIKNRPDVIYCRPIYSPLPMIIAKIVSSCFIIEVVNGYQSVHTQHPESLSLISRIKWIVNKINYLNADRIASTTKGLRDIICKAYNVPLNKMILFESATNINHFKIEDKVICRKNIGLPTEKKLIGFIGSFFKHQGIDILIDAAPSIIKMESNIQFVLIGDGTMKNAWKKRCEDKNIEDYFLFTGQIPYVELPHYINSLDICVAPFRGDRGETSPLKLFDYFACGKPVVSSDIPSIHQLLLDSKAAILVPPDDPVALAQSLIDILKDDKKQKTLGNYGRKFVTSKYSWEAQAKLLVSVIEDDIHIKGKPCA